MKGNSTTTGAYLALALSAASGMIYQVVSMNYLFFYFIQNTYSIATVLSVFLLGLGLGSYLIYRFREASEGVFVSLQIITGIYGVLVLANLEHVIPKINPLGIIAVSTLILLPPTICLGATFPLAARIAKKESEIGKVYTIDLIGAVLGTALAGFLLIPIFGNSIAAYVAGILNFLAAIFLVPRKNIIISLIPAIIAILILIFINHSNTTSQQTEKEPILNGEVEFYPGTGVRFSQYSPYGKIMVVDNALRIDTREQCRLFWLKEELTMVGFALDPLNRTDLQVANIGLGCGGTAAETLRYVNGTVDVIEINPVVVRANRVLSNVQENERINIIIDEGITHLRNSPKIYDAILIDIEEPSVIHASNLYTAESFSIIASRLSDDGVLALWSCPCPRKEYSDTVYNTLKEAFPYVYKPGDVTFVASKKPLPYPEYQSESIEINTLDRKILSTIYFDHCAEWFGTDYQKNLIVGGVA